MEEGLKKKREKENDEYKKIGSSEGEEKGEEMVVAQ